MKRKNGSKKEKIKKVENDEKVNTEESESESESESETSGSDEEENDEKVEIEPESEPVKEEKTTLPAPLIVRPTPTVVYGRVKVKFRNSNSNLNSNLNSKPPPVEVVEVGSNSNDEDKSNRQVTVGSSQGGGVVVDEKVEESVSGLCESKKCGGIKIVSSKGLSPTGTKESGAASGSSSLDEKKEEQEMKSKSNNRGEMLRFNKQELEASLEVIKKVMKMDAAEPFNVPVNPVELGIPDYFDVIDTPMDFGTICNNLESGGKYMNSADVYKDVQYIWDNCFKYNNKGDYIVDLMKRVKKNFMKYWMAAGLYTEQTKKTNGGESIPIDEATSSGHGKKLKKGKGVKRHKDGCMCAICIMKRRRREREAREAREARESGALVASPQLEGTMMDLPQECKQEVNSHAESPHGEDTSSYMETSPDVDADAEMEDAEEVRLEGATPQYDDEQKADDDRVEFRDRSDRSGDISEKSQRSDKGETETYSHVETKVQDESGSRIKSDAQKQLSAQPDGQTPGYMQQRHEFMELEKKRQRLRLIETFRDLENPMLLDLCGTLFPNKRHSVWNGANSLARHHSSNHRSDIHEAIASFMTPYKSSSSHSRK